MDTFSLLKYWRGGGGGGGGGVGGASTTRDSSKKIHNTTTTTDSSSPSSTTTTTILTAISPTSSDSDDDNDDDGPFFDLEFTLPDDSDTEDQTKEEQNIAAIVEDISSENDFEEETTSFKEEARNRKEIVADVLSDDNEIIEGDEIKFTLSSSSSADSMDPNVTLSPSDDLFFKGRLVPMESSSDSDAITKFPVSSIFKSATKFRVLMLNFNKGRANVREKSKKSEPAGSSSKEGQEKRAQSRFFTVKLKVEEVPLVSLFTRDSSSKGNATGSKGSNKKSSNEAEISDSSSSSSSVSDDKKFSKDVMQKYLKKVKPLYIRVSKRYSEKLRFSGQLSFPKSGASPSPPLPQPTTEMKPQPEKSTDAKPSPVTSEVAQIVAVANTKTQKHGNLQAGLRVVCKHLGKSRSASSAAMAVTPSAPLTSNRRDDSLLQQQDGIQGAILHCKRSFNASRDLEGSILSRSASDPSHDKSLSLSTQDSSSSSEDAEVDQESTLKQK